MCSRYNNHFGAFLRDVRECEAWNLLLVINMKQVWKDSFKSKDLKQCLAIYQYTLDSICKLNKSQQFLVQNYMKFVIQIHLRIFSVFKLCLYAKSCCKSFNVCNTYVRLFLKYWQSLNWSKLIRLFGSIPKRLWQPQYHWTYVASSRCQSPHAASVVWIVRREIRRQYSTRWSTFGSSAMIRNTFKHVKF